MRMVVGAIAAVLAGCATVEPASGRQTAVEEVNERNYETGTPYTTVVGDTLVRVRKYVAEEKEVSALQANMDFAVKGGGYDLRFARDQVVPVTGTHMRGGQRFYVAPVETTQFGFSEMLSLLVAEDGRLHSKALDGGFIFSYRAEPADGRLSPVRQTQVVKSKPFSNYEIVFNGSDGLAMRFTYREYSPDDFARTAFFQELSYPVSARVIRFRNLLLDVTSLDEQAITVVVRSD